MGDGLADIEMQVTGLSPVLLVSWQGTKSAKADKKPALLLHWNNR
jgi:hypothetical protein